MLITSTGDMAQQFTSLRNGNAIKSELLSLAESLGSGKVADLTKSLNGQTTQFSGLRYRLTQLEGFQQVAVETQQTLANMQIVMDRVDARRGALAERLLPINESSSADQVATAAAAARNGFGEIVTALNTRLADRALFSGNRVNVAPLAAAETMLADLQVATGGATDAAVIRATVDTWFNDPAGGFATLGYMGDGGPPTTRNVGESRTISLNARADDPEIRQVLQGAALAALADSLPGLSRADQAALLKEAGSQLFGASSGMAAVQARVGFAEAAVDEALAETNAQQTTLGLIENELSLADPFETASRLQAQQLQLETFFSVTARLSQLSLLRFI